MVFNSELYFTGLETVAREITEVVDNHAHSSTDASNLAVGLAETASDLILKKVMKQLAARGY